MLTSKTSSTFKEYKQCNETEDCSLIHGLLYAFIQRGKTDSYVLTLNNGNPKPQFRSFRKFDRKSFILSQTSERC
jgi:hypothetical protein